MTAPAPLEIIDAAITAHSSDRYPVRSVYALFSGGHDSLVSTAIAARHPLFAGAVHINTGIGIEQTREFVRATCREQGWPLFEVRALEDCGQCYRSMVLDQGFPGPALHYKMFQRLKERPLRHFIKRVPHPERTVLVSGRRLLESSRRSRTVKPHDRNRRMIFASVIYRWSALDVTDFIEQAGLRRNPVVDLLHMSGECLCGAFAQRGELDEIRAWFPEKAAEIEALEGEVRAHGFPWGWEGGPTATHPGQLDLDLFTQPLCTSCVARRQSAEATA